MDRHGSMVSLMGSLIDAIACEIYPANVGMLKRKVADSIYDDLKLPNYDRLMGMANSMCESTTALPRGSEQGDVLLACMSTHFTYYQVQAKFKDITGAQFSEERYTEARKKMMSISGSLELKKLQ